MSKQVAYMNDLCNYRGEFSYVIDSQAIPIP